MVLITIPFKDDPDSWDALYKLNQALGSLKNQTTLYFTILVAIDGDISDNHAHFWVGKNGLNDQYSFICKNVPAGRSGPGAARQVGIDFAFSKKTDGRFAYDYLMFLDADDMLLPNAVEDLNRAAKTSNYDVVTSPIITETNLTEKTIISAEKNTTWTHGTIYSTQFLYDNKIGFYTDIQGNEDSAFNLIANTLSRKNRGIIEIPTYLWRYNVNSITRRDPEYFASWATPQYVLGISRAILEVLDKDSEFDKNLIYTIIELYHKYELCVKKEWFRTSSDTPKVYSVLTALFKRKEIQDLFSDKKIQEAIARNVHGAEWCNNEMICFREGIDYWANFWMEPNFYGGNE